MKIFVEKEYFLSMVAVALYAFSLDEVIKKKITKDQFNIRLAALMKREDPGTIPNNKITKYYSPENKEIEAKGDKLSSVFFDDFCIAIDNFFIGKIGNDYKDNTEDERITKFIKLRKEVSQRFEKEKYNKKTQKRLAKKSESGQLTTITPQHSITTQENTRAFLSSLQNTSWTFIDQYNDKDDNPNFLTFYPGKQDNILIAELVKKHPSEIWEDEYIVGVWLEKTNNIINSDNKKTDTIYWKGEATYNSGDTLLSVVLFSNQRDQIQLNLVMDDRLMEISWCLGHKLSFKRNQKQITKELTCLVKCASLKSNMQDVSIYEIPSFRKAFEVLKAKLNAVPFNPVVHDTKTLKTFFENISPPRTYNKFHNDNYSLFFNVQNKEVQRLNLKILSNPFSDTVIKLTLKDDGLGVNETYTGLLVEGQKGLCCPLQHEPLEPEVIQAPPIYLYFNLPNPHEGIDIITGAVFGPVTYCENSVSGFAIAVVEDKMPDKKINRYLVTKILQDHKAGDKLSLEKYELTSAKDLLTKYKDYIDQCPDDENLQGEFWYFSDL